MECEKVNGGRKNLITKTWQRCRSIPASRGRSLATLPSLPRSLSTKERKTNCKMAPHGCFFVYVGPEKQRFVIKTKYVNHPLFKVLLEDAENEYGFISDGPILLPCDVNLFYKVLAEMDDSKCENEDYMRSKSCGLAYGSYSPFNPTRRSYKNGVMGKGFGSYGLLTPSRLIRMN
ncbi:hypothetical protein DCAR_0518727 [Daucus carota subsp. sativus]|uniref:Uncharacterized protein n=1 Tax=Daucus carota subsp. sativus TaxID=79200 RepID=A0A164XFW6_DAUCS|nr:PREDICTED: auxin-responsive protein SAUR36-like [Daucus carota subsp. sativus]WOG99379.1 hypothetical protein DCAR_0518727 [Daucus carota subsp. sativus]